MKRFIEICTLKRLPKVLKAEKNIHKVFYFYHTGSINKTDIEIILDAEDSEIELNGAILGKGTDEIFLNTVTKHIVGNNNARVNIKTVLNDQSKFDFTGMIEIYKNAQKSDSYLQQDNLVVSPDVVCNSSPQLEIQADDVKASHGATVGSFSEEHLFYLKSRGLSEAESKELIAEGFLSGVFGDDLEKVKKVLKLEHLI